MLCGNSRAMSLLVFIEKYLIFKMEVDVQLFLLARKPIRKTICNEIKNLVYFPWYVNLRISNGHHKSCRIYPHIKSLTNFPNNTQVLEDARMQRSERIRRQKLCFFLFLCPIGRWCLKSIQSVQWKFKYHFPRLFLFFPIDTC